MQKVTLDLEIWQSYKFILNSQHNQQRFLGNPHSETMSDSVTRFITTLCKSWKEGKINQLKEKPQ